MSKPLKKDQAPAPAPTRRVFRLEVGVGIQAVHARTGHFKGMPDLRAAAPIDPRQKAHLARVDGGRKRHTKNDAVRDHVAHLLTTMRPSSGWDSPKRAFQVIEDALRKFLAESKPPFSIVNGAHLHKPVTGWFTTYPAAREAYERGRCRTG